MTEDTNKERGRELLPGQTRKPEGLSEYPPAKATAPDLKCPEWVRRPRHPITRGID